MFCFDEPLKIPIKRNTMPQYRQTTNFLETFCKKYTQCRNFYGTLRLFRWNLNCLYQKMNPAQPLSENITLAAVQLGQSGTIQYTADQELCVALLNLGIKNGTVFSVTNIAPLGDLLAIAANGTKIAIRKKDAVQIIVKILE
jgi:ferrous iron transport protein A